MQAGRVGMASACQGLWGWRSMEEIEECGHTVSTSLTGHRSTLS